MPADNKQGFTRHVVPGSEAPVEQNHAGRMLICYRSFGFVFWEVNSCLFFRNLCLHLVAE